MTDTQANPTSVFAVRGMVAKGSRISSDICELDSTLCDGLVAHVKVYRPGKTVPRPDNPADFSCVPFPDR